MKTGMIHHVEIYVSDLSRSEAFWGWLLKELGYTLYQKWREGVSFRQDDTYLVFVQTEEEHRDAIYHRKKTGFNHLAFHAASRDVVDALTEKLEEKSITVLYEDRHPFAGGEDYYAVFFEDPDRIKVEVAAP